MIRSRSGRPGTGAPGTGPGGLSRPNKAAGDPSARSGRTVATDVAARASRASSVAVPEVGSSTVVRIAGLAPVTPADRVSDVTWPSGSGA